MRTASHLWWLLRLALAFAVAVAAWFIARDRGINEYPRLALALAIVALWTVLERAFARDLAVPAAKDDGLLPVTARQEATLIRRKLSEGLAPFAAERARLRSPYAVPWYLLLGPEGVGKSTVIGNSGLRVLGSPATEETTRGCAVIATGEAAFFDVAASYVARQSLAGPEAAGWRALLAGIADRRPRLPLNGVILALSPADLVLADPIEREDLADGIRARLRDVDAKMRSRVPVYVLLTKLDLVPGFIEYFDRLDADQRSQAWGFAFPLEEPNAGVAAVDGFVRAFDALLDDLKRRQVDLLHRESDRRRSAMILGFPSQLAALMPAISDVLERVFRKDERGRRSLLRAVFLTSGRQDLLTIDRLLPSMAERFALPPTAALPPDLTIEEGALGWFITRPLRESILREAGLIFRQRNPYRGLFLARAAVATMVIAVCALVAAAFAPAFQNTARQVQELIGEIDRHKGTLGGKDLAGQVRLMDFLASTAPDLPTLPQPFAHLPPPLDLDPGHMRRLRQVFEGGQRLIYDRAFLPVLVSEVQDSLADAKLGQAQLAGALHAYRMLGGAEQPDAQILDPWLQAAASRSMPGDALAEERRQFVEYGLAMAARAARKVPLDHDLLASADLRLSPPARSTP
jgi:type VI secretion system protein ImpL